MQLFFNWGIHMALESTGAAATWCVLRGCTNAKHSHSRLVRFLACTSARRNAVAIAFSATSALALVWMVG